jgi:hypothetical protein
MNCNRGQGGDMNKLGRKTVTVELTLELDSKL